MTSVITIDPDELGAAARTMQQCSLELADVGREIASCVGCPMPADVAPVVDQLVATADAILGRVGTVLLEEAIGLTRRAILATLDSLAAASGATRESAAALHGIDLVAIGAVAAPGVLSGVMPTVATIGGTTTPGFTITTADGAPATSLLGAGVVGGTPPGLGTLTIVESGGSPTGSLLGTGVVGGSWSPDPGGITITPGPVTPGTLRVPIGSVEGQRLIDNANMTAALAPLTNMTLTNIRYGAYAIGQNQAGYTPRPQYDWPG